MYSQIKRQKNKESQKTGMKGNDQKVTRRIKNTEERQ